MKRYIFVSALAQLYACTSAYTCAFSEKHTVSFQKAFSHLGLALSKVHRGYKAAVSLLITARLSSSPSRLLIVKSNKIMAATCPNYSSLNSENFQTLNTAFLGLLYAYQPYLKAEN